MLIWCFRQEIWPIWILIIGLFQRIIHLFEIINHISMFIILSIYDNIELIIYYSFCYVVRHDCKVCV